MCLVSRIISSLRGCLQFGQEPLGNIQMFSGGTSSTGEEHRSPSTGRFWEMFLSQISRTESQKKGHFWGPKLVEKRLTASRRNVALLQKPTKIYSTKCRPKASFCTRTGGYPRCTHSGGRCPLPPGPRTADCTPLDASYVLPLVYTILSL